MVKLWEKGYKIEEEIEEFTVGDDYKLDMELIKADVLGSIAHARMLNKIGILTITEYSKLKYALIEIYNNKNFTIKKEDEDVHTAIENYLVSSIGDIGKKIHTGRSRNDQIIVDIRLFTKERMLKVLEALLELLNAIHNFAMQYEFIPIPGYTHTRKAMPSSIGLWAGALLESILDDIKLLKTSYEINNQSPLGSAAGYGVNLNIDREFTAQLLGFENVQNNVLYVQNSRGKIESIVIFALLEIVFDVGRISNELILFSSEQFGFFTLPDEICTGSSIMPQKKNPDVLELIRGKVSVIEGNLFQIFGITKNLISGYSRDLQLTKEPLIKSLKITYEIVSISTLVFKKLRVDKERCISACTKELYATDSAFELVKKGKAFRDAYAEVAMNIDKINIEDPIKNIKAKKYPGATGNLGLRRIKRVIESENKWLLSELNKFKSRVNYLLK